MFTTKLSSVARTDFSIGLLVFEKQLKKLTNFNEFLLKNRKLFF